MKRKQYSIRINAPREQVWEALWTDSSYMEWTSAFSSEGSRVVTDWQEGSRILFLNAKNEGMIARIEERKPPGKMAIKHLGMIDKDGNEDMESEKVKAWSGAEEIYVLTDTGKSTDLVVKMDMDEGHEDFFDKAWPKAFEKLKNLAEKPSTINKK